MDLDLRFTNLNTMKTQIIGIAIALGLGSASFAQSESPIDKAKGLETGADASLFEAKDLSGDPVDLKAELEKGPVVLVFYRGEWCPICTKHLSNMQDSLKYITDKGAQVFAISPENQTRAAKTRDNTRAEFQLIFDDGYAISDAYGVTFTPTDEERDKYNSYLDADLENAHSDGRTDLPIPATYVISQDGTIVWRQFNPDYKVRASVADILEQL